MSKASRTATITTIKLIFNVLIIVLIFVGETWLLLTQPIEVAIAVIAVPMIGAIWWINYDFEKDTE